MRALKGSPRRVNDERAQAEKDQERLPPPDVGPHGFAKGASRQCGSNSRHALRIMTRGATQATEHQLSGHVADAFRERRHPSINTGLQAGDQCYGRVPAVLTACFLLHHEGR